MILKPVRPLTFALAAWFAATSAAPALADSYPVSGRWGQSASTSKGPIECHGRRIVTFNGEQRFDTGGGVPGFHNKSVETDGTSRWRIVDQFTNGQIRAGNTTFTLEKTDADHIVLNLQGGHTLKLQRCK
jgi:hypothetical protein